MSRDCDVIRHGGGLKLFFVTPTTKYKRHAKFHFCISFQSKVISSQSLPCNMEPFLYDVTVTSITTVRQCRLARTLGIDCHIPSHNLIFNRICPLLDKLLSKWLPKPCKIALQSRLRPGWTFCKVGISAFCAFHLLHILHVQCKKLCKISLKRCFLWHNWYSGIVYFWQSGERKRAVLFFE